MWRHFVKSSCQLHVNHTRVGSDIINVILWTRKFNIKYKRLDWIKRQKIYHFIKRYTYKVSVPYVPLPPPSSSTCVWWFRRSIGRWSTAPTTRSVWLGNMRWLQCLHYMMLGITRISRYETIELQINILIDFCIY